MIEERNAEGVLGELQQIAKDGGIAPGEIIIIGSGTAWTRLSMDEAIRQYPGNLCQEIAIYPCPDVAVFEYFNSDIKKALEHLETVEIEAEPEFEDQGGKRKAQWKQETRHARFYQKMRK